MHNGRSSSKVLDLPEPFAPCRITRPPLRSKTRSPYCQMFTIPPRCSRHRDRARAPDPAMSGHRILVPEQGELIVSIAWD